MALFIVSLAIVGVVSWGRRVPLIVLFIAFHVALTVGFFEPQEISRGIRISGKMLMLPAMPSAMTLIAFSALLAAATATIRLFLAKDPKVARRMKWAATAFSALLAECILITVMVIVLGIGER